MRLFRYGRGVYVIMKKIFLIAAAVSLTVVMTILLSACRTEASIESLLSAAWIDNIGSNAEQNSFYDVYGTSDGERKLIGLMNMTVKYYKNEKVSGFSREENNFTGNRTGYTVDMRKDGKRVEIRSEAFFSNAKPFAPLYSYKEVKEDGGLVYEIKAEYSGKNYEYTLTDVGGTRSGKIKLSGVYFDNEMIFALIRSCPLDDGGSNLDFSFNVPSPLDDPQKLTAMKVSNLTGGAVEYQKYSLNREEYDEETNVISVTNALHFKYASAENGNGGLETYYAKLGGYPLGGFVDETYIPVFIKQNGIEYVFCKNKAD